MNFLSRLIMILIMSISLITPVAAAVVLPDVDGYCGIVAADDDKKPDEKKTDGDKKPEDDEEEPDCD